MKNVLTLGLLISFVACKNDRTSTFDKVDQKNNTITKQDDDQSNRFVKGSNEIRQLIKEVIPENISNSKTAIPKIISLNSKTIIYFDLNQNKVITIDLKTKKEVDSFSPIGGGYLYFYNEYDGFRAFSNGWEGDVTTRIETLTDTLSLPNNIILDCSGEKVIISEVAEGIEQNNKARVYNLKTKNKTLLKFKVDEAKFIDANTFIALRRFPEQQEGELLIYNLQDDSYKTILNNFSANNFIDYSKRQSMLYYVTNGLVHSFSLETNEIKVIFEKSIYLPFIIEDSILTGYIYDKAIEERNLIFTKL